MERQHKDCGHCHRPQLAVIGADKDQVVCAHTGFRASVKESVNGLSCFFNWLMKGKVFTMASAVATAPVKEQKKDGALSIPQQIRAEAKNLDMVVREARAAVAEASTDGNEFEKQAILSHAIRAIRAAITPGIMEGVMDLQNSPLGFDTDRKNPKDGVSGYHPEVVKEVMIVATMQGYRMVGGETTIISGRFYREARMRAPGA